MSTEGYDSSKSNFDKAADSAKESFNEASDAARDAANDFRAEFNTATNNGENKKVLAGILAIVVGSFGIHKFILGYNKEGVIQILLSFLCGLGGIIALVEGIIYLTKSDEEFYQTYQAGKKGWF